MVNLDINRTAVVEFTVKNNTRRRTRAEAKIIPVPADSAAAAWLSLPPPEGTTDAANANFREFEIDGTQKFNVKIAAAADAAPGTYTFKLNVADEIEPDENFVVSPDVSFTVAELPKVEEKKFPVWIIPVIAIIVLVLIGVIIAVVVSGNNTRSAEQTQTAVAEAQMTEDANATNTAAAANLNATQVAGTATAAASRTAAARATQTAVAQGTQNALGTAAVLATQDFNTRINRYVGNWEPASDDITSIVSMTITRVNNLLTGQYSTFCAPAGNLCFISPQSFTIANVPYSSDPLNATIQNTRFTLNPTTNGSQLSVTIRVNNGSPVSLVLNRVQRFNFDLVFELQENLLEVNPLIFTNTFMNTGRSFSVIATASAP
jgi:hypothetical protein